MEPQAKKAKLTNHFRVALRPYDVNVQRDIKRATTTNDTDIETFAKNGSTSSLFTAAHQNASSVLGQLNHAARQGQKKVELITIADEDEDLKPTLQSLGPNLYNPPAGLPSVAHDYDQALLDDIRCEPHYAWDSFNYDKEREINFRTKSYIQVSDPENRNPSEESQHQHNHNHHHHHHHHHQDITPLLRAELVDWLVNIQNYYALDHEALYMAVKIADQYLMRKSVPKNHLPLLYITAILISAKYDERIPPVQIGDLIVQTRNKFRIKYNRKQVINFEADILVTLQFDIRFPLSYGFLRRFAQCTRSDKRTLTLARYILESSLLNYETIEELESKIAAASLLLAFRMLHTDGAWNEAAEFYTGYRQEDLLPLTSKLNESISTMGGRHVRNKYSNEVFMSVAKIPPLCQNTKGHLESKGHLFRL